MLHGYLPTILEGAGVTLQVALLSLLLALVSGLAGAAARLAKSPLLRWPAALYTTVVRGVPDLVLMLLVFYGGQMLINAVAERFELGYFDLNPFIAGVLTIGFLFGAYFTETFRGAFLAVPAGQLEAGAAFGMSRWQVFRRILFPQMLRYALPGIGNNWLVLLKSTAIVSMIGLADMTWLADQAGRNTHQPFLFYALVCALYLVMTSASGAMLRWLEKRYSVGVRMSEL